VVNTLLFWVRTLHNEDILLPSPWSPVPDWGLMLLMCPSGGPGPHTSLSMWAVLTRLRSRGYTRGVTVVHINVRKVGTWPMVGHNGEISVDHGDVFLAAVRCRTLCTLLGVVPTARPWAHVPHKVGNSW